LRCGQPLAGKFEILLLLPAAAFVSLAALNLVEQAFFRYSL
jgi:hypothetical protein